MVVLTIKINRNATLYINLNLKKINKIKRAIPHNEVVNGTVNKANLEIFVSVFLFNLKFKNVNINILAEYELGSIIKPPGLNKFNPSLYTLLCCKNGKKSIYDNGIFRK